MICSLWLLQLKQPQTEPFYGVPAPTCEGAGTPLFKWKIVRK